MDEGARAQCRGGSGRRHATYFDDGHDVVGRVLELGHVDIEMAQLVLLGLFQDQVAAVPHGINAPQVAGGVEVWVWGARQGDLGDVCGGSGVLGHVVFGIAVESKGRVAVVGVLFVACGAIVADTSAGEEAHDVQY